MMAKKYKGFKGSGYSGKKNRTPKYKVERMVHTLARATLAKMGINSKY